MSGILHKRKSKAIPSLASTSATAADPLQELPETEHTYPPAFVDSPPQRSTSGTAQARLADTLSAQTLYESSPHRKKDEQHRFRSSRYTDPSSVLLVVLLLGLLVWILPTTSWLGFRRTPPVCSVYQHHAHPIIDYSAGSMPWQKEFTLSSRGKGCHLVTNEVQREISEGLKGCKIGLLTLFIKHTSASLSLNENYDPTVRTDMSMAMDHIVPDHGQIKWEHTDEGPDDSSSHTKAGLFGSSITIPITNGQLNTGTWQGVYLCEWRKMKHSRKVVATILP